MDEKVAKNFFFCEIQFFARGRRGAARRAAMSRRMKWAFEGDAGKRQLTAGVGTTVDETMPGISEVPDWYMASPSATTPVPNMPPQASMAPTTTGVPAQGRPGRTWPATVETEVQRPVAIPRVPAATAVTTVPAAPIAAAMAATRTEGRTWPAMVATVDRRPAAMPKAPAATAVRTVKPRWPKPPSVRPTPTASHPTVSVASSTSRHRILNESRAAKNFSGPKAFELEPA